MLRRVALLSGQWGMRAEGTPTDAVLDGIQAAFPRYLYDREENLRAAIAICA